MLNEEELNNKYEYVDSLFDYQDLKNKLINSKMFSEFEADKIAYLYHQIKLSDCYIPKHVQSVYLISALRQFIDDLKEGE